MLADAVGPTAASSCGARSFTRPTSADGPRQAGVNEFVPLDGQFRDNVIVQVKNGPIDFQPREPFHPLFGAMPETPLMIEFQITKEYLGFATHLVYLGTLLEEVLDADTYADGQGSTVADVIDGDAPRLPDHRHGRRREHRHRPELDAAPSSTRPTGTPSGGSPGTLRWPPRRSPGSGSRMTFTDEAAFVEPVVDMMMASREAAVNYMTPLGLAPPHGDGPPLRPRPVGRRPPAPRLEPGLLPPCRRAGHRLRPDGERQQRRRANTPSRSGDALWQSCHTSGRKTCSGSTTCPWDYRLPSHGPDALERTVRHYDAGVDAWWRCTRPGQRLKGDVDPERLEQRARLNLPSRRRRPVVAGREHRLLADVSRGGRCPGARHRPERPPRTTSRSRFLTPPAIKMQKRVMKGLKGRVAVVTGGYGTLGGSMAAGSGEARGPRSPSWAATPKGRDSLRDAAPMGHRCARASRRCARPRGRFEPPAGRSCGAGPRRRCSSTRPAGNVARARTDDGPVFEPAV